MIAPRTWRARRAAWVKRLAAAGAAVLPLPASNLLNHLCQLAWAERTLVLGAGDPLLWLAVVVGHEARDENYELAGVADPATAAACRRIVRGWRLGGKPVLTGIPPAGPFDLVIADRRRETGKLPPGLLQPGGALVLYGGTRAANRAIVRQEEKNGLTASFIPWGDGVTVIGNPPAVAGGRRPVENRRQ